MSTRMSRPASAPEARKYPSVGIRNGSEGDAIRCTGARAPRAGRTILSFPDYLIHEDGTIFSLLSGRVMKVRLNDRGYVIVGLYRDGKQYWPRVHRLLAETFIPNDDATRDQINHKDGTKTNNALSNLEWVTPKENDSHARRTGLTAAPNSRAPSVVNRSGFVGVSWDTRRAKWRATAKHCGRKLHLGYFDSKDEARTVRDSHWRGYEPQAELCVLDEPQTLHMSSDK